MCIRDRNGSYMIGDHLTDIVAAHRAGCKGILVMTGRGKREFSRIVEEDHPFGNEGIPDATVEDLWNAYLLVREWER
jgi:histidinol phosphatase-like enzyme